MDLSRNLGTSYGMINRHYDGVQNIIKSDQLLKLNKHYYDDSEKIMFWDWSRKCLQNFKYPDKLYSSLLTYRAIY